MNETKTLPKTVQVRVPVQVASVFYVEVEVNTEDDDIVDYVDITDKAISLVESNANMGATTNVWNNTIIFDCDLPFEIIGSATAEIADEAFDEVFDQVYEALSEED